MPTPELSRSAPALLVWKTQLKSTDGQILQVQFGLFPICREGEWNWTRLLVVCTPYLAMYVSTSVPQAFQAISINHFCCHSGWPHRQVKQDVAILRGVRYWKI